MGKLYALRNPPGREIKVPPESCNARARTLQLASGPLPSSLFARPDRLILRQLLRTGAGVVQMRTRARADRLATLRRNRRRTAGRTVRARALLRCGILAVRGSVGALRHLAASRLLLLRARGPSILLLCGHCEARGGQYNE